jgi:hypothetical protein
MIHFVVHKPEFEDYNIMPLLDIFGDKYLVCKHTDTPKHHWHFQGEVAAQYVTRAAQDKFIREMSAAHPDRVDGLAAGLTGKKLPRPIARKAIEPDGLGYQYMMHCGRDSVVVSHGFTEDELDALWAACEAYKSDTKAGLVNHLKRKFPDRPSPEFSDDDMPPERVHREIASEARKYLVAEKAEHIVPANIRNQVFTFFHQAPWSTEQDGWYLEKFFM